MSIGDFFQRKTLLYGGGIVVLIIFVLLLRHGGSAATAAPVSGTGPTDAQVNASTQLQLASISAATSAAQTNAQLAAQHDQLQEALAEKGIDAQVALAGIAADSNNTALQVQASTAQTQYLADLQASVAKWTLDAQTAQTASNNAFQLDYAKAANSSAEALATIQAGVINNQIMASRDTTIATLQATAAQTASYINGQVAIQQSGDQKDIAIADINAGVAKKQSSNNLIGGIVGGILGIFSDPRLKVEATLLGRDPDGLGIYSYRYRGDKSYQIGVMADEVRRLRPWAHAGKVGGFDTVNYGRL